MALKPLHCTDEQGQRWVLYEEDIGFPYARKLHLLGVRELVLPRSLIAAGDLTMPPSPAIMDRMSVQMVRENPALATLLRRYVRLADCVAYLEEQEHASPRRDSSEAEDAHAPMGPSADHAAG